VNSLIRKAQHPKTMLRVLIRGYPYKREEERGTSKWRKITDSGGTCPRIYPFLQSKDHEKNTKREGKEHGVKKAEVHGESRGDGEG